MKNIYYTFFVLLFLFVLSCKTSKNTLALSLEKDFQTLLDTSVNDKNIGILLHVESPNQGISWSGASGYDDVKNKTKLLDNQCFRIASVTKTFVACSILRLWEDRKLSLDDPISKYISKAHTDILKKGNYDADKITIRHLITHSSGLFDHTNAKQYFEKVQAEPAHVWTRTEQLEALVNWGKPVCALGEKFSYADTGYILLGEIIERITGKSMNDAFFNLLNLKQLGLKHTQIEDAVHVQNNPKNRIHQYTNGDDTYNWNCSIDLYGGGGLLSTTKDLALYFQGLFQYKVFKNKTTLDTMLAKTTYLSNEKPRMDYRKGIYLVKLKEFDTWTHTGYWGTQVVYIPSLNITMATNYSNGWRVRGQAPVLEKVISLLQK
jgi:D-alanyl-D-alanine carboxypeptidase